MKKYKILLITPFVALFIFGCKKDTDLPKLPQPINEPEVITSLSITLTDSSNVNDVRTFEFIDSDGDGGNQPIKFDTIFLKSNTTYIASLKLFNGILNEEITSEIEDESNDHLFVYKTSEINLEIEITDLDNNTPPLPIGLRSKWRSGIAGNGTIQIILKHQPGIKDGSESPGNTDVDLNFQTKIIN